jgi:hypothetical protein
MKKGNYLLIVVGAILVLGSVSCTYYTSPGEHDIEIPQPDPAYIGSEKCETCHQDIYGTFANSGHPFALSKVENGQAPVFPYTSLDYLPSHFSNRWSDVSYAIGGYAWKYQFADANGFVYTGDDAQHNFQDNTTVPYLPAEAPGTVQFSCGKCHTTGWVGVAEGGSAQDGLAGMGGEFFDAGVQCEACHGMGSVHEYTRSSADIDISTDAALCGQCHSRNDDHSIAAADGFILNYTQYDEMLSAGHKDLSCVSCHDPHASVKHGQTDGIIKNCTECHADIKNPEHNGADCITCHMPYATRSATSINKYEGDVKTHIFKINPEEEGEMFSKDGSVANGSTGVTLEYVCYQCHRDYQSVGGTESRKTRRQLSAKATDFHK